MPSSQQITAEEYARWLPPDEAVKILATAFGVDSGSYVAKHTLLERIRGGRVRAVDQDLREVGPENWKHVREEDQFWVTGDLTFETHGYHQWIEHRFFHVRFEADAVRAIVPPHLSGVEGGNTVPTTSNSAVVGNKGGRPSKPWWQEFWVEMCCRVFEGDIQPNTTQAAILEQMQQWVSDHDYQAGETVLKDAAKKLSRALKSRSET